MTEWERLLAWAKRENGKALKNRHEQARVPQFLMEKLIDFLETSIGEDEVEVVITIAEEDAGVDVFDATLQDTWGLVNGTRIAVLIPREGLPAVANGEGREEE